jgi:hypothetical protein
MYVTRTFPNRPLPQSVGFSSVRITTFPADPQIFAMNREIVGPQGEVVAGLGDAAFYNGIDMLYVRVGSRGFSVRFVYQCANRSRSCVGPRHHDDAG